jgi:hypothetical protein
MAGGLMEFPWRRRNRYLGILWGGLIAGTLDILAAFVTLSTPAYGPMRILQGIASGLLGRSSFRGGWGTALLGLACHFAIAFGAAAIYYFVSRRLRVLVKWPVVCGLLYGIPIYICTNFVIIPLSKIGMRPVGPLSGVAISLVVLMVCVGLPIALMIRRFAG